MNDKETIKNLLNVISIKDKYIISALKRIPFKELSDAEQRKVIMNDILSDMELHLQRDCGSD